MKHESYCPTIITVSVVGYHVYSYDIYFFNDWWYKYMQSLSHWMGIKQWNIKGLHLPNIRVLSVRMAFPIYIIERPLSVEIAQLLLWTWNDESFSFLHLLWGGIEHLVKNVGKISSYQVQFSRKRTFHEWPLTDHLFARSSNRGKNLQFWCEVENTRSCKKETAGSVMLQPFCVCFTTQFQPLSVCVCVCNIW